MRRVAAKQSREEVAPLTPRWRRLLILTKLKHDQIEPIVYEVGNVLNVGLL